MLLFLAGRNWKRPGRNRGRVSTGVAVAGTDEYFALADLEAALFGPSFVAKRAGGEPGSAPKPRWRRPQALGGDLAPPRPGPLGRLPSRGGTIRILAGPAKTACTTGCVTEGGRSENRNAGPLRGNQRGSWEGDGLEAPPGPEKRSLRTRSSARGYESPAFGIRRLC